MALKGVNLGGWLVAERWITPELFEGVEGEGERAIGYELGVEVAHKRLDRHRRNFITEGDFRWIKAHGFDFIRLPVGYWLFFQDDGFVSGEQYVTQAFRWADKYHLGVILDFHGLPGSQNGQDHSGQTGRVRWLRRSHRRYALETVRYLARKYGQEPSLIGLELINEPKMPWWTYRLVRYYVQAFRIAQPYVRPHVALIASDAFQPVRLARALARKRLGPQLVLDIHLYQLFNRQDRSLTYDKHLKKVDGEWRELLSSLSKSMPILVGEWSAALPPAAIPGQNSTQAYKNYYEVQRDTFGDVVWAHAYWSYKARGQGPWSLRDSKFK